MELNQLLQLAIKASLKAGEEIMEVYDSDFAVEKKEDKSPLTQADKNSHLVIEAMLESTGIPVLSEEGKSIPYSERKGWKRLWIVDPLDGTKEFVKRNGEFTVNIALVEEGKPVLGVIYQPVTDVLYFAGLSFGAYKMQNTKIKDQRSTLEALIADSLRLPAPSARTKFTVVASRSHMSSETFHYVEELKKKHGEVELISAGSSLKICLVAEGAADTYPRFGPTMEWDTAAGQAIAESAGKEFIDVDTGKAMVYNREDLLNHSFIVR